MAKQYKIKRYRQYGGGNSFRAKPRPVTIVFSAIALVALVVLGVLIYQPFMDFLNNDSSVADPSFSDLDPDPVTDDETEQETDPEPDPVPVLTGDLRAAYMPGATALDPAARGAFLDSLSGSGVNAVMVDIKDETGAVLFGTVNEQAISWNAVSAAPIDLIAISGELQAKGLSLVVRMCAFRDPIAAGASREIAVAYQDTTWLWLDNTAEAGGKPWLNPYSEGAREYLISLAVEAAEQGAVMVVLENVQCPPGSETNANFGASSATVTRSEMLSVFMEEITSRLEAAGAGAAHYIPAISLTQESENSLKYGGSPLAVSAGTIVVGALPYQFGGSYDQGGLAVAEPVENPGPAVTAILSYLISQFQNLGIEAPAIIPLVQGGSEPDVNTIPYTAEQVAAQLAAVNGHGLDTYILYSTTGEYLL